MGRPKTGVTPVRNIRVAEELWRSAQAEAEARGETLTDAIVRALQRYVHGGGSCGQDHTPGGGGR
jgi:hypothetical protein